MSQQSDTVPLHPSSQSDIDEIENLINFSVQSAPATVLPARPPSLTIASIPISTSPFVQSNLTPPLQSSHKSSSNNNQKSPSIPTPPPLPSSSNVGSGMASTGFSPSPNTLTEPVGAKIKRDLSRIVSNLKLVVFPNPYREDPGKAFRD